MDAESQPTPAGLAPGLALIRRRRWCLWGTILLSLPLLKVSLMLSHSLQVALSVVGLWPLFPLLSSPPWPVARVAATTFTCTVRLSSFYANACTASFTSVRIGRTSIQGENHERITS